MDKVYLEHYTKLFFARVLPWGIVVCFLFYTTLELLRVNLDDGTTSAPEYEAAKVLDKYFDMHGKYPPFKFVGNPGEEVPILDLKNLGGFPAFDDGRTLCYISNNSFWLIMYQGNANSKEILRGKEKYELLIEIEQEEFAWSPPGNEHEDYQVFESLTEYLKDQHEKGIRLFNSRLWDRYKLAKVPDSGK